MRNYHLQAQLELQNYQTNHVLHLLMTIFTGGLWFIVWALVSHSNSSKREALVYNAMRENDPNNDKYKPDYKGYAILFGLFCALIIFVVSLVAK